MYEQPTPGRRFGPALIALLVVLAAMAGTMGYLVAHQIVVNQSAGTTGTSPTGTKPASAGPITASPVLTGTTQPTVTNTTDPGTSGTSCPAITEKAVLDAGLAGGLTLKLYVHVNGVLASDTGAEAWVCENKDGVLIYQGHVESGPLLAADSGSKGNTLLLAEGIKGHVEIETDGFLAVNPSGGGKQTEYHVHRDFLTVIQPSGKTSKYPVIGAFPA